MTETLSIPSGSPVSTWELLRDLGFAEDQRVFSDLLPGLSFDFGNFKLSASAVTNLLGAQIVLLSGAMFTERTARQVECQLPRQVESLEQGVAWVVWCLDDAAWGTFEPRIAPPWLAEGRRHRHLLPWERAREAFAAYAVRPRCEVERDWAKVALKTLEQQLATVDEETHVIFSFDGTVLKILCPGKVIAVAAEGLPWAQQYSIKAGILRSLPKRLMRSHISVSVWKAGLTIGHRTYYPLVGIVEAGTTATDA